MVNFNSYVKLPEGIIQENNKFPASRAVPTQSQGACGTSPPKSRGWTMTFSQLGWFCTIEDTVEFNQSIYIYNYIYIIYIYISYCSGWENRSANWSPVPPSNQPSSPRCHASGSGSSPGASEVATPSAEYPAVPDASAAAHLFGARPWSFQSVE
jgi:hypothetical protein